MHGLHWIVIAACGLALVASCASPDRYDAHEQQEDRIVQHPPPADARYDYDEDWYPEHRGLDMANAMQAKLIHTQAIVEGLALSDLEQVRANAEELIEISEDATWLVHDTVTYIAMSEEFRQTARNMARNAAQGDADAVIVDYTNLTRSCIACHTYLRRERETKDMPGRVSLLHVLD